MVQSGGRKLLKKHASVKTLSHREIKTTMLVKSVTPYLSALKKVGKLLYHADKHGSTYVTVLGMGKAVEKTLAIGCHFQEEKHHKVEVFTRSIQVLDEMLIDAEDEEYLADGSPIDDDDKDTEIVKRGLSGVELRIYR